MNSLSTYFTSSVGRKQIVAVTGLLLILFVIGHLAGNLLIFLGPEAFNNYAKKLAGLRPGLYLVEVGLCFVFVVHFFVTGVLVYENYLARNTQYGVNAAKGQRSWATRLMPYTGTLLLVFVLYHLWDFTFIDKHGPRSILADGNSYGLYGVVVNAFADPGHSTFYIAAMMALGLHLSHGVESFIQTFGFNHPHYTPMIKTFSHIFALVISFTYSSIPVYILLNYPKVP
ncbi:MAG: succinate dehydrogenase cytochrome b subunit [Candidatus Omnitrophota bacterium]|nr:succinate dehydrogenase cytochrome b subunit [Candidatus Omnitrophota bacterium]